MASITPDLDDQSTAESTPADVAVLYSWANLQGAKYRDYSASRREHRAQARYKAAKALLERELSAQKDAETAAARSEQEAFAAEAVARSHDDRDSHPRQMEGLRNAEAAARKAAAERVEAARRAEAAAHATVVALREQREITEAHTSAQQQAMIYTEAEERRRALAGPQPHLPLANADTPAADPSGPTKLPDPPEEPCKEAQSSIPTLRVPGGERSIDLGIGEVNSDTGAAGPAWLYPSGVRSSDEQSQSIKPPFEVEMPRRETLQEWRERVASRWFALQGVFDQTGADESACRHPRGTQSPSPMIALFSIAGGVGKTSLVATLGRALGAQGEKVLLADTTSQGLLPFYFGSTEAKRGHVQTIPPRPRNAGEPVSLLCCGNSGSSAEERQQRLLLEEILTAAAGCNRLLIDIVSGSNWLLRLMADANPTVLVPIAPDMNSVISLQSVEKLFHDISNEGRPILPVYVLNQFDAKLALHLDVREVFRRRLGDRLLPVSIRNSPMVSEALAEGATIVDYAPGSPVAQDYHDVAAWLKSYSPAAIAQRRGFRWGER